MAFIFDRDSPSFRLDIPFNRIGGDTITIQYKFWNVGFGSSAGWEGGIVPEVLGSSPGCGNNVLIGISRIPIGHSL